MAPPPPGPPHPQPLTMSSLSFWGPKVRSLATPSRAPRQGCEQFLGDKKSQKYFWLLLRFSLLRVEQPQVQGQERGAKVAGVGRCAQVEPVE